MTTPRLVAAAGCIVWRHGTNELEVLVVHRPRLQDWSFPKGKLERGEAPFAAAVREVEEETGLRVKLGPRLPDVHYRIAKGVPKVVHYWAAQPRSDGDVGRYAANDEIDRVRWWRLSKALKRLTYPYDKELLDAFASSSFLSAPLLVVRHGEAWSHRGWHGEDSRRPLKVEGQRQAKHLSPLLDAYGVSRVISSDAARCVETVLPYVNAREVKLALDNAISEDGVQPARLKRRVDAALRSNKRIAMCSHRPVLPLIFEALGVEAVALNPAGVVVLHRRDGLVLDQEIYP